MRVFTPLALVALLVSSGALGCRACPRSPRPVRLALPRVEVVELWEADERWAFDHAGPGDWLAHERTLEVRLWRHVGGARAVWRRRGRRLLLNGREHGVDLTGLSGARAARWLSGHRHWAGWVVLEGAALTPVVLRQLRRARRLGVGLVSRPGRRLPVARLSALAPNLVALSLKEARLSPGDVARLAELPRLEALSLAGSHCAFRGGGLGVSAAAALGPLRGVRRLRLLDLTDVEVRDLGFLEGLGALRRLLLAGTRVEDRSLDALDSLPGLRALDLSRTGISDFGVDRVSGMTGLRALDLSDTGVTDLGADLVAGLAELRVLRVGPHITDLGLAHLSDLGALRVLALRRAAISGGGLARLRRLAHLRSLDLAWTDVGDPALRHLRGLVRLRHLDLARTRVTGVGLRYLAMAHQLTSLSLRWTPLVRRHLRWLTRLTSLRQVDLTGTAWRRTSLVPRGRIGYKAVGVPANTGRRRE